MGNISIIVKKPPIPPEEPEAPNFSFDPQTYIPPEGDDVDFIFTP